MRMLRNHHAKSRGRQQTIWSNHAFDFTGPTAAVARRLVGALLLRRIPHAHPDSGTLIVARIVETEAYLPLVDPACHAYRGPTRRNVSAFGRPGSAYVYFIYGNHFCLNVVTEWPGIGAAVLIRAAEPLAGLSAMRRRRPNVPDAALLSGPGNLCRAMAIDRADDGVDLRDGALRIVAAGGMPPIVASSPRIGLSVACDWPLRFFDPSSKSVSPYRPRRVAPKSAVHLVDGHARPML
jgi:DNA-3-methyladenine glycosylase